MKAQNAAPIAIRRHVSVCRVRAARQRRVRVLGLLATALGEHARGFTPSYIENLPRVPATVRVSQLS